MLGAGGILESRGFFATYRAGYPPDKAFPIGSAKDRRDGSYMADIFISYAREDVEPARRLAAELKKRGWSVFWDRRIPAGRRFEDVIEEELRAAGCVIVLWSTAANKSKWVRDEAREVGKRNVLVPALIEAVEPPMGFRSIQAANLIDWQGEGTHEGFEWLLEDIRRYGPPSPRAPVSEQKDLAVMGAGSEEPAAPSASPAQTTPSVTAARGPVPAWTDQPALGYWRGRPGRWPGVADRLPGGSVR